MNIQTANKYQKRAEYPEKSYNNNIEKGEDDDYYLKNAEAILGLFIKGKTFVPYGNGLSEINRGSSINKLSGEMNTLDVGRRSITEIRQYARGKNPMSKYHNNICDFVDKEETKRRQVNISWDVPQIMPHLVKTIIGKLSAYRFVPNIKAIDTNSLKEREQIINYLTYINNPENKEVLESVGIEPQVEMEMGSNVDKTLRAYKQNDAIKILKEIDMVGRILSSLEVSGFEEILQLCEMDIAEIGATALHVYTREADDMPMVEWIDIDGLIIPNSKYKDFKDASYWGFVENTSYKNITEKHKLTDEKCDDIRKAYGFNNSDDIDKMSLQVGVFYWCDNDTERYEEYENDKYTGGRMRAKGLAEKELTEAEKKNGKKDKKYNRQVLYRCEMIIGTKIIISKGPIKNMAYQKGQTGKMCIVPPIICVRTQYMSIVENVISLIDDINLKILLKRVDISKLPAMPNISLDTAQLGGISLNKKEADFIAVAKHYKNEGVLAYNSVNEEGQAVSPTGRQVIEVLPDTGMARIQDWTNEIDVLLNQLYIYTGINALMQGQGQSPDAGKAVAQMVLEAASNAQKPNIQALISLHGNMYSTLLNQWQVVARHSKKGEFRLNDKKGQLKQMDFLGISDKIGASEVPFYNESVANAEYEVMATPVMNDMEKQRLIESVMLLNNQRKTTGGGGITTSVYIRLIHNINTMDNILKLALMIEIEEEAQRAADAKVASENNKQNMESNMASSEKAKEDKLEVLQLIEELKQNTIKMEEIEKRISKNEEILAKGEVEKELILVKNELQPNNITK